MIEPWLPWRSCSITPSLIPKSHCCQACYPACVYWSWCNNTLRWQCPWWTPSASTALRRPPCNVTNVTFNGTNNTCNGINITCNVINVTDVTRNGTNNTCNAINNTRRVINSTCRLPRAALLVAAQMLEPCAVLLLLLLGVNTRTLLYLTLTLTLTLALLNPHPNPNPCST